MHRLLESSFSMASKEATHELMPFAERLVPFPNGKSIVWKYFGFIPNLLGKIEDKRKVYCKLCDSPFALSYSTNTSNLTYCLNREHLEEHRKVLSAQGKQKQALLYTLSKATPFSLISHSNHGSVRPYDKASKRVKQLVNAIAQFVSLSLQPIRVNNEQSFRNLLSMVDPWFELPHRTYFTTKVIPDLYNSVCGQIESQLASIDYCTITTDLWTSSHQHRSYISLTVHFVDSLKFVLSLCLQTLEVPKEHITVAIQQVLSSMFEEWDISSKVFGVTTDSGQNIVYTIELLSLEHFSCVAHTLQLAIKKVYAISKVHMIIARCKN